MVVEEAVGSMGDHPRSRGVYERAETISIDDLGSSPLARGLPLRRGNGEDALGIIPARAGFTSPIASRPLTVRDHPRSRGVYE